MSSLFPELEPPAPQPVATTAPLFDVTATTAAPRQFDTVMPPIPGRSPTVDVALFETVLVLPDDTEPGALAFRFTVE